MGLHCRRKDIHGVTLVVRIMYQIRGGCGGHNGDLSVAAEVLVGPPGKRMTRAEEQVKELFCI
jgi:hypothetical protein